MSANSICTEDKLVLALDRYEKLIFSICYRMTMNYFDAEDLTQETFLAYYRVLPQFDGKNEKAYLTKIATNKCLDYLKRAGRKEIPSESPVLEGSESCSPSLEDEVMEHVVNQQLEELCATLKPPYNRIAAAYYVRGQTAGEIAQESGKKVKTIQTQIGRARKMLQKLYQREGWSVAKGRKE